MFDLATYNIAFLILNLIQDFGKGYYTYIICNDYICWSSSTWSWKLRCLIFLRVWDWFKSKQFSVLFSSSVESLNLSLHDVPVASGVALLPASAPVPVPVPTPFHLVWMHQLSRPGGQGGAQTLSQVTRESMKKPRNFSSWRVWTTSLLEQKYQNIHRYTV